MTEVWVIQHDQPDVYGDAQRDTFVGIALSIEQAQQMVTTYLARPQYALQPWVVSQPFAVTDDPAYVVLATGGAFNTLWMFRYTIGDVE